MAKAVGGMDSPLNESQGGTNATTFNQARTNMGLNNLINGQTGNYTATTTDRNKLIHYTGAGGVTLSLDPAATLLDGWSVVVRNDAAAAITIDPDGGELINGAATLSLDPSAAITIYCTGSAFYTEGQTASVSPSNAPYITAALSGSLSDERVLTAGGGMGSTDGGAGGAFTLFGAQVVNAQTMAYTAVASDRGKVIYYTGAGGVSLALDPAATLTNGWYTTLRNDSSGTITIDPDGGENINGAATLAVTAGQAVIIYCNGSLFYTVGSSSTGAPVDATYIVQTPNSTLTNEQAMSALATGIVKNTTTTGVQSIAANGTDYYGPGTPTPVPVTEGGTGRATSTTAYGLLAAGTTATGTQQTISPGTSGQALVSGGASALASFGTLGVNGGGTGLTSFTAYAVICGGTTSTGALQSIASVGTSGQVLTSNGAGALPTFQSNSGGAGTWVFLASVTPSGSATAVITTNIDSTYDEYVILASNCTVATDAVYLVMRVSTDGGSTYKSGASDYNYAFVGNGTGLDTSGGANAIVLTGNTLGTVGNAAGEGYNCTIWMHGPSQTTTHKMFHIWTDVINASTVTNKANHGTAVYAATTAINALQWYTSSGNFSGTYRLYGIKKS